MAALLSQDGPVAAIPIVDVLSAMVSNRSAVMDLMRSASQEQRDDMLQGMLGTALCEPKMIARGWDNASSTAFKCTMELESRHPYSASTSSYHILEFPGASSITLTFDDRSETDPDQSAGDFVAVYKDSTYTATWGKPKYHGEAGENWPGAGGKPPLVIPSDSCVLHFHSDTDGERWGYRVKIEATINAEGAAELSKQTRTDGKPGTWPLRWCQQAYAEALNRPEEARKWLQDHADELEAKAATEAPTEEKVNGLFRDGSGSAEVNVQTGEVFLQGRVTAPTPTVVVNMQQFREVFGESIPLCGVEAAKVACQSYNIVSGGHRYIVKAWKPVGVQPSGGITHLPDKFDSPVLSDTEPVPASALPPTSHWNAPQLVGGMAVFRGKAYRWSLSADDIQSKMSMPVDPVPEGHEAAAGREERGKLGHHWAWEILHEAVKEAQEQLRQQRDATEKEADGRKPEGESAEDQVIDTTFFLPYRFVDMLQESVDNRTEGGGGSHAHNPSSLSQSTGVNGLMYMPPTDESRDAGTRPGTWFEVQWCSTRCVLTVYQLLERARRCVRSLVWCSDCRFGLKSLEESIGDRSRPWHRMMRHAAGNFLGSLQEERAKQETAGPRMFGQAKRLRKLEALKAERESKRPASLEIVREPVGTLGGLGVHPSVPETYVSAEMLHGLMPEVLLEGYAFWRHSFGDAAPVVLIGYPQQPELIGTYIRAEISP